MSTSTNQPTFHWFLPTSGDSREMSLEVMGPRSRALIEPVNRPRATCVRWHRRRRPTVSNPS